MFFTIISQAFFTVQTFILVFPDERPVFLREINNHMYSHSSYFVSKVTAEMPLNIFLPMVFSVIVYWSVNLNVAHWYNWWFFYVTLVATNLATSSYALCLGIACSEKAMAVGLTPVLLVPMGLFSGFLVNRDQIPFYLLPFNFLSIYKYGLTALILNEYEDNILEC